MVQQYAEQNARVEERGFEYRGSWGSQLNNPKDGMPLQQDGIFISRWFSVAPRNPAADLVAQGIAFEYRIAPCDLDQAAFGGHDFSGDD